MMAGQIQKEDNKTNNDHENDHGGNVNGAEQANIGDVVDGTTNNDNVDNENDGIVVKDSAEVNKANDEDYNVGNENNWTSSKGDVVKVIHIQKWKTRSLLSKTTPDSEYFVTDTFFPSAGTKIYNKIKKAKKVLMD